MKRTLFVLLGVCSVIMMTFFVLSVLRAQKSNDVLPIDTGSLVSQTGSKSASGMLDTKVVEPVKPKTKIEQLKIKYSLRGLIHEGNSYFENEQYALALKSYLDVYAKTDDKKTAEKIAETYFAMKKFSDAHKYYSIITASDTNIKAFLSLLYHKNIELPENITSLVDEIGKLSLSSEYTFFYKTSLGCIKDFHLCKKSFEDYFAVLGNSVTTDEMKQVKSTLDNYKNFKMEDVKYKDALLIGAFYQTGLYPIVIKLGKDLLKLASDYQPMILMIAQSYFELGDYKNAKIYLEKYKTLNPEDKNATYLLGVIYLRDHDYMLSNIHLNKALELGYEPTINVKRRLLYNYEKLGGQDEKLLIEFEKLVTEEPDVEKEDVYLALYYHIINEKLDKALELAKFAQVKFPDVGSIYGYMGWIYKEKGEWDKAEEVLKKGLTLDSSSPLLNLNMGLVLVESGEAYKAVVYLKQVIKENKDSEFGKKAAEELAKIGISN